MRRQSNAKELEIVEIAAVSLPETDVVGLRLLDRDEREWVIRLPMEVLDACLCIGRTCAGVTYRNVS